MLLVGMPSFVRLNVGFVLQSESYIVESFEQAMAGELVDLECGGQSKPVVDCALLEIDANLVVIEFGRSASDLGDFIFAGLATNDAVESFSGALLVAVLAGCTDLVFLGLYRLVRPAASRSTAVPPRGARTSRAAVV